MVRALVTYCESVVYRSRGQLNLDGCVIRESTHRDGNLQKLGCQGDETLRRFGTLGDAGAYKYIPHVRSCHKQIFPVPI